MSIPRGVGGIKAERISSAFNHVLQWIMQTPLGRAHRKQIEQADGFNFRDFKSPSSPPTPLCRKARNRREVIWCKNLGRGFIKSAERRSNRKKVGRMWEKVGQRRPLSVSFGGFQQCCLSDLVQHLSYTCLLYSPIFFYLSQNLLFDHFVF